MRKHPELSVLFEEILKKTERSEEEFFRLLEILKRKFIIVPLEELVPYVKEAEKLRALLLKKTKGRQGL